MIKKSLVYFLFTGYWLLVTGYLGYAKEITILYTGETHAMLYPCFCPKEADGGVARRATLIKQFRKNNPDTLVLDSGGFFAGGLMDEYTQNTELDMQRTRVNLKALELMKYDALNIGDDEFNFGKNFLLENINKINLNFISCNIKSDKISPYIIKEVAGIKIGIIGVTNLAAKQKAGDLIFIEPKIAVENAVEELKKKNTDIIILLSHLGESEDLRLIKEIKGIDIIIIGHSSSKEETYSKIGSTLVLKPSWQGRHLCKLTFVVKEGALTEQKVEDLRLSDEISDDPGILSILPPCFSDNNCKKEGMIGTCENAGTLKSQCLFTQASKVSLLVITPKLCNVCDTQSVIKRLKTQFPGLSVSYLYYPNEKAKNLIKDFDIKALPVYLLGKEVEREKGFNNLRENLEIKGVFYMLKPQFSGIAYFVNREKLSGKLDIFISLYDKDIQSLLEMIKEFNPVIHFLAAQQQDKFEAAKGSLEVQEDLRSVCVQRYYPEFFWDYIICRAKDIGSSWWEDCLGGLDTRKIKICAQGPEGKTLLEENIGLNKELKVMFGPAYLLNNQEVFGLEGIPTKEEFKKIIKR